MKPKTISTKIWRPVLDKLTTKIEQACLRRDAYLNCVLDVELPALERELPLANSATARQFIADHLDRLDRKPVSLSLRPDLVERLDDICEQKRIVRDSFFNRLFFFLAVPSNWFDVYFPLEPEETEESDDWRYNVWMEYRNEGHGWNNVFHPLEPDIDPFWALRTGLELSEINSDLIDYKDAETGKVFKVRYVKDDRIALPECLYTVVLQETPKGGDLWGLNCYLPDWQVQGHPEQIAYKKELDDLLESF